MTAISGVEFLIWLLIAASVIAMLANYLRIPYTVSLVLGGLLLSLLRIREVGSRIFQPNLAHVFFPCAFLTNLLVRPYARPVGMKLEFTA